MDKLFFIRTFAKLIIEKRNSAYGKLYRIGSKVSSRHL